MPSRTTRPQVETATDRITGFRERHRNITQKGGSDRRLITDAAAFLASRLDRVGVSGARLLCECADHLAGLDHLQTLDWSRRAYLTVGKEVAW